MTDYSIAGDGSPLPKRVPLATVETVLGLYREKYFDLNVRHFHEKLKSDQRGAGTACLARRRKTFSFVSWEWRTGRVFRPHY